MLSVRARVGARHVDARVRAPLRLRAPRRGDRRDIASICDLLRFLVSAPSIEARAVADAVDVVVSSGAASALCELASMPGVVSRRADNVAASCVASACLLFMAIRYVLCTRPRQLWRVTLLVAVAAGAGSPLSSCRLCRGALR